MRIFKVGDIITNRHNTRQYKVLDVGIGRLLGDDDSDLKHHTEKHGGSLHYLIEYGGLKMWVIADYFLEVTADEDARSCALRLGDEVTVSCNLGDAISNQVDVIADNMTSWMRGNLPREDSSKLPDIVTLLLSIQYDKEGSYGSSWKGKGEYRGIMANIDRKYDRLDKITDDEINGRRKPLPTCEYDELSGQEVSDIGESKIDAVADLANYCILYMSYLKETYPGAFRVWVAKNIPAYLREKIPFLSE